eukprot:m.319691 g.319691  ORF g.319691 m.319691 type:complete len:795 (+) comp19704_c0_seq29:57-2441(+)
MAPSMAKMVKDLSGRGDIVAAATRLADTLCPDWPPNQQAQAAAVRHGAIAALLKLIRQRSTPEIARAACSALVNLLLSEDASQSEANHRIDLVWKAGALRVLMELIDDVHMESALSLALLCVAALGYGPDEEAAERRDAVLSQGAVAQALRVFGRSNDADVQRFAIQVVGSVCRGMDSRQDRRIQAAFDAGSVPVLLQAVRSHHDLVVASALDTLVSVSYGDGEAHAERARHILNSGVVEWLVAHQRASSTDDQRCCLAIFANIMLGSSWGGNADETMETTVEKMVELGVLDISMSVLRDSDDEEVKISAGTCCSNICHSHCGARAVHKHLPELIALLERVQPGSHVRSMLLGALGNAACFGDKDLKEYMVTLGVVDLLVPVMTEAASNAEYGASTTQVFGNTPQSMVATIAIASLIGQEENNPLLSSSAEVFDMFTGALKATLANQTFRHVHWSLHMILGTLANLSVHDGNKHTMLEQGLAPLLLETLHQASKRDAALEQATRVLWNLTFFHEFAENPDGHAAGLLAALKALTTHSNEAVRRNAVGSMFQIKQLQHGRNIPARGMGSTPNGHVMLSYNWPNQDLATRLQTFLEQAGYSVWADEGIKSADTLEFMAKAVEDAAAVVVLLSPAYKESEACRTEGEYAYCLNKPLVAVTLQEGFDASGWLGALVGARRCVAFWNTAEQQALEQSGGQVVEELCRQGVVAASRVTPAPNNVAAVSIKDHARSQGEEAEAGVRGWEAKLVQQRSGNSSEAELLVQVERLATQLGQLGVLETRLQALEGRHHRACCTIS